MTLAEVFAFLAFVISLLLTIVWTTPFLVFIINVNTQIVKHRKALQSADFYGILIGRKGAVLQVQRSCFPPRCHCSCHRQEEVQFFVILLTVRLFLHEILEGGFHHGSFKYCFFRTEPFGYSHHRCHQCDMDDFEGCLPGQTSGKTLFEKIMTRKMTARSDQTPAVIFSNVTPEEGS